jgi:hypothetical protein
MAIWWLIAGAGLALGVSSANREIRAFERSAADEIASKLSGEKKRVNVRVKLDGIIDGISGHLSLAEITARDFSLDGLPLFTETHRPQSGRIKLLRIKLHDFVLRGLAIEELRADINDCRYDVGLAKKERKIRLSKSGTGEGYVRVNEKALEDFILHKYHEIKSVSVQLKNRKVYVEGYGEFALFKTDFYVIADLVPKNDYELHLDNAIVFLGGARVRDGTDRVLLRTLNPVIHENEDLRLHGALKIEQVKILDGKLELTGTAIVPPLPE